MSLWCRMMLYRLSLCLFAGMLFSVSISSLAATSERQLIIRVPKDVDNSRLTVSVGQYGHGLVIEPARRSKPGEYVVRLSDQTESVKLLIHHPECKVIATELDRKTAISKPYAPKFVKATMVPLTLRLMDTSGKPITNQPISIGSNLAGHKYYNYIDGSPVDGKIAKGMTDSDGKFTTRVPSIFDDPYYRRYGIRSFGIHLIELPGGKEFGRYSYDILSQPPIPTQRNYTNPVIVTIRCRGMLSGKVERSFLHKHGITGKQPWVSAQTHGDRGACGVELKPNGLFDIPVSAGTHDLTVRWSEGKKIRSVMALKGVTVGENEKKVVRIR